MKITRKLRGILLLAFSLLYLLCTYILNASRLFLIAFVLFVVLMEIVNKFYSDSVLYLDNLTDLYNRKKMHQDLKHSIKCEKLFMVVFIDLKNFKSINDNYGHQMGNYVLKEFARALKSLPKNFKAYRNGGDEFVVIVENYNDINEVIRNLTTINVKYGDEIGLKFNFGISIYPEHATNADMLLACSDEAMYCAKTSKRQYCIYCPVEKNGEK